MKSPRQRPPLNLTDPDPEAVGLAEAEAAPEAAPEAAAGPEPEPRAETDRPMSERRRRRLAEERRQAEQKAAEAARREEAAPSPAVMTELSESADAPPVAYEPPSPPAVSRQNTEPAPSGRHAYLLAGVAAALWIGGVAAWLAYEIGSGAADMEPLRLAVYALIALAPAGLAIMLAHAVRQGAGHIGADAQRLRVLGHGRRDRPQQGQGADSGGERRTVHEFLQHGLRIMDAEP